MTSENISSGAGKDVPQDAKQGAAVHAVELPERTSMKKSRT
jgi:hypothetical protein